MKAIFEPEEIALKRFVIRWRGYDTREVETFLRAVAADFRRLIDHAEKGAQPPASEDQFAELRNELNRLSSNLDRALAALERTDGASSVDLPHLAPGQYGASASSSGGRSDPIARPLRLVSGGSGGA
jgi:DivIVA domain-containing protein